LQKITLRETTMTTNTMTTQPTVPLRSDALRGAFCWIESKEGWLFWATLYNELLVAEGREEDQLGL
jgi:hypothetical protein